MKYLKETIEDQKVLEDFKREVSAVIFTDEVVTYSFFFATGCNNGFFRAS